jgi:hypothetical protein
MRFFAQTTLPHEPLLKQLLAWWFLMKPTPRAADGISGALGSTSLLRLATLSHSQKVMILLSQVAQPLRTWLIRMVTPPLPAWPASINVLRGESELLKLADLMKAYGKYTAGAKWNGSFYTDVNTGVRARNHVLIYQDTYMMGKGYMGNADLVVPEKYFSIK